MVEIKTTNIVSLRDCILEPRICIPSRRDITLVEIIDECDLNPVRDDTNGDVINLPMKNERCTNVVRIFLSSLQGLYWSAVWGCHYCVPIGTTFSYSVSNSSRSFFPFDVAYGKNILAIILR